MWNEKCSLYDRLRVKQQGLQDAFGRSSDWKKKKTTDHESKSSTAIDNSQHHLKTLDEVTEVMIILKTTR